MPIEIPQAQINYFDEHGYLELEDYLTESQVASLHAIIETHIDTTSFDTAYMTGHDLWRKDPAIKKIAFNRDLANIFSELTKVRPLRFGFDQILYAKDTSKFPFTKQPTALKDMCSLGPPAGGVLINLSKSMPQTEEPLPHAPGSILLFKDKLPISFPTLLGEPGGIFLLIAYCHVKPLYIECKNDPHLHYLKSLGYTMGDHLTLDTHPLLIK